MLVNLFYGAIMFAIIKNDSSKENTMNDTQKIIVAALVGFVIGFGACWMFSGSTTEDVKENTEETATENENATTTAEVKNEVIVSSGDNAVLVLDQTAGKSVLIDGVSLEKAGWVAIYEDFQGPVQRILGAKYFSAGESKGAVTLLRGTVAGKSYHAVLLLDNGDKSFNHKVDTVAIDDAGKPVAIKFEAK